MKKFLYAATIRESHKSKTMKSRSEKLKNIEAIFFDLDGTLMDTDDQAAAGLSKWLKRLGFRRPDHTARRWVMNLETPLNTGMTLLDMIGLDGLVHRIQEIGSEKRSQDRRFLPVQDLAELVERLSSRYILAVVTTRSRRDTDFFLIENGLKGRFQAVVTRESSWRIKPHPAPLFKAASLCSVPIGHCLMVGDTVLDIRAARRAGAFSAAVLCGFGKKDELQTAGADVILDHTKDLLTYLGL